MIKIDTKFALHHIDSEEDFGFNAIDYSKFKFGSKNIARVFGQDLAKAFIESEVFKALTIKNKQIVVCSSPYSFIPTATFAMKDYFVQVLNQALIENDMAPVEETKIHRTITYKDDYGSLDAVSRMNLIGNDSFHIDSEFVKDKVILFLDDIRITGSHERVIKRMVSQYKLTNNMVFLYFAELKNTTIHPKIENDLNFAFVKNLLDLDKVIKNENFLLNTRVVKFILNSSVEEFKTFINYQSEKFISNIYYQAIGNGYSKINEYKGNLDYIKNNLLTAI